MITICTNFWTPCSLGDIAIKNRQKSVTVTADYCNFPNLNEAEFNIHVYAFLADIAEKIARAAMDGNGTHIFPIACKTDRSLFSGGHVGGRWSSSGHIARTDASQREKERERERERKGP